MTGHRVVVGIAVVLLLAGCGNPELVLINRSDAVLTVGPGVVIKACDSLTLAPAAYETARAKGFEISANDDTWEAPTGALVWNNWAFGAGNSPTRSSIVVSGAREPQVYSGSPPETDLPPCGGAPIGIEPGLPQGEMSTFEFDPASP